MSPSELTASQIAWAAASVKRTGMNLDLIPVGPKAPFVVNVIVEIPSGSKPVKYEIDKVSGAIRVDRFLHTAMFYPGNYGFIPHTLAADRAPTDVLVICDMVVMAGAVIAARPIRALIMADEAGPDEKILAVPADDVHPGYAHVRSYKDLPKVTCDRIAHFFQHYKDLETDEWVSQIVSWVDDSGAQEIIRSAMAASGT